MQDRPDSLAASTLMLTAVGAAAQVLGFCWRWAVNRWAGPEAMGLYQLLMSAYAILLSLTVTGLTVAVSTLTARERALGRRDRANGVLRCALGLLVRAWLPLSAVVLVGRGRIAALLGDERCAGALTLLVPVLLLTGVENLTKHALYGQGQTARPAAVEMGEQVVRTGSILLLMGLCPPAGAEGALERIVWGILLSEIFSAGTLTLLRRRENGAGGWSSVAASEVAAAALPVTCTALLGNLMGSANAVLIPRKLAEAGMGEGEALAAFGAVFGMTLPLLSLPSAFVGAICLSLPPRLSRLNAMGRKDLCRSRMIRAAQAVTLVVLPALSGLALLAPVAGRLLFHSDRVGEHLLPLTLAVALGSYESIFAAGLNGLGRQAPAAAVSLLCGAAQLLCTLAGQGMQGYLWGAVITSVAGMAVRGWMVWHWTRQTPHSHCCHTSGRKPTVA